MPLFIKELLLFGLIATAVFAAEFPVIRNESHPSLVMFSILFPSVFSALVVGYFKEHTKLLSNGPQFQSQLNAIRGVVEEFLLRQAVCTKTRADSTQAQAMQPQAPM